MPATGRSSRLAIVLIMAFAAWASVRYRYIGAPGNDWHQAINSDGKSYYEYLRLFLFPEGHLHIRTPERPTAPVINQFAGAAACMAPFVLAAHAWTLVHAHGAEDGYSLHYQVAVGSAALCWMWIGLLAVRRFLLRCGASDNHTTIALVIIALGTGLILQAVVHPAMSHVYGFAIVALLLRRTQILFVKPSPRALITCAVLLAWAAWIRPVNALVIVALPLAAFGSAGHWRDVRALLISRWGLIAGLVITGILALQGLLWLVQSGSFLRVPYPGEGFHWTHPAVAKTLFGARNGLFFYWPLLLLLLPGAWALFRISRRHGMWFTVFFVLFIYVTASWWNWAYGDNFGQRTYVDVLAVCALPLALAVPSRAWLRNALIGVAAVLCALNLFQAWQYHHFILVPGQVDARMYAHVLLCTDQRWAQSVGGHSEMPLFAPRGVEVLNTSFVTALHPHDARDTTLLAFAPMPPRSLAKPAFLELDIERSEIFPRSSNDARIVLRFKRGPRIGPIHHWRMNVVPDGRALEQWHYAFTLHAQQPGDTLQVLATNSGHGWSARVVDARLSVAQ